MSNAGDQSTTGNEYEQPGVNYPDRADAEGVTDTPRDGEPTRDTSAGAGDADAGPVTTEPSHTATGVGVVDDGHDHHGQDQGRDTLTASEAQQTAGALGDEQEMRLPAMAQNNAPDVDKVAGIVAQTRADVGTESLERIAEVLRQRVDQAGVAVPDNEIEELARQVSTGDAAGPDRP